MQCRITDADLQVSPLHGTAPQYLSQFCQPLSPVGLKYVQQTQTSCSCQESTLPSVPVVFTTLCLHRGTHYSLCFVIPICLSDFRPMLKTVLVLLAVPVLT